MEANLKARLVNFIRENDDDITNNPNDLSDAELVNYDFITEDDDRQADYHTSLICALIRRGEYQLVQDLLAAPESAR